MAKIETGRAKLAFDELSAFTNQQPVIDALERAGKDRTLLRRAKRDAKAFLKAKD